MFPASNGVGFNAQKAEKAGSGGVDAVSEQLVVIQIWPGVELQTISK